MKWNEIGLGNSNKSYDLYRVYCHKSTPCTMDMVMGYSGLAESFTDSKIKGAVKLNE